MFSDNISKRDLWRYVNKKLNKTIHHYHVLSVISILFDEIVKDLKADKPIKIFNFGTLYLKKTKPRKYHSVVFRKIMQSKGHKIMKLSLSEKIRKKLCSLLDLDATFKDD